MSISNITNEKIEELKNEGVIGDKVLVENNSFEFNQKKFHSESTSMISSEGENSDSDTNSVKIKIKRNLYETDYPRLFPRSKSNIYKKKSYSIDVVNEERAEDEGEKEYLQTKRKTMAIPNIKDDVITNTGLKLESLNIGHRVSSKEFVKNTHTSVMDPVVEVKEEIEKPERKLLMNSPRISYLTDTHEDAISPRKYYTSAFHTKFDLVTNSVITEDNNENAVEFNDKKKLKIKKKDSFVRTKIEHFVDKSENVEEGNNEINVDTDNIETIKEENYEEEDLVPEKIVTSKVPISDTFEKERRVTTLRLTNIKIEEEINEMDEIAMEDQKI